MVVTYLKNDKEWSSGLEVGFNGKCIDCEDKKRIFMDNSIYGDLIFLLDRYSTEFAVYFHATQDERGDWTITDMYIPHQEVTGTSVEFDNPEVDRDGTKMRDLDGFQGKMHSHNTMGVTYSPADNTYSNRNHAFTIVMNKKYEYNALVRTTTKCGRLMMSPATLVRMSTNFSSDDLDRIKRYKSTYEKNKDKDKSTSGTSTHFGSGGPVGRQGVLWDDDYLHHRHSRDYHDRDYNRYLGGTVDQFGRCTACGIYAPDCICDGTGEDDPVITLFEEYDISPIEAEMIEEAGIVCTVCGQVRHLCHCGNISGVERLELIRDTKYMEQLSVYFPDKALEPEKVALIWSTTELDTLVYDDLDSELKDWDEGTVTIVEEHTDDDPNHGDESEGEEKKVATG
jgi:hypothetical protein